MIERLLPAGVASVEAFADVPEETAFPPETAAVARAVAKRRREFATVRHCARQALGQLGLPAAAILPGERGAPQWPTGVVGSLTHCDGYRAAALAHATEQLTLGIDAEPAAALPDGVAELVIRPEEADRLAALAATDPGVPWDRLLFSAKESVYKAWYPLARCWLDFAEASLTISPAGGFEARLLVAGPVVAGAPLTGFTGRWLVSDGLIVTAIALPVPPA